MYLQTHIPPSRGRRPRATRLGNAPFDICELYRGLPSDWGLQPLNASCGGGGGYSAGDGRFSAANQFPPGGFIGPIGTQVCATAEDGWTGTPCAGYPAKPATTPVVPVDAHEVLVPPAPLSITAWLKGETFIKGVPNWMLLAGGAVGVMALRDG